MKILAEPPACPVNINTISIACKRGWPVSIQSWSVPEYFMLVGLSAHSIQRPNANLMLASVVHNGPSSD